MSKPKKVYCIDCRYYKPLFFSGEEIYQNVCLAPENTTETFERKDGRVWNDAKSINIINHCNWYKRRFDILKWVRG